MRLPRHTTHTHNTQKQTNRAPADNEKRLVRKCRELNGEIVSNAAKVRALIRGT